MRDAAGFRAEQRRVAAGMAAAMGVAIILPLAVATWAVPAPVPDIGSRLAFALRVDVVVALWLAVAIGNVARLRFLSPDDIGGSGRGPASPAVRTAAAILQNTLEQACLAVFAHLIVAATLPTSAPYVGTLAALFCIGRLLFWIGYDRGAASRAFGFALTFYPSALALLTCAALALQ